MANFSKNAREFGLSQPSVSRPEATLEARPLGDTAAPGALRGERAAAFHSMLTPQDAAGWRGHVTIQKKALAEARDLLALLSATFWPRRVEVVGLAPRPYRGGPWKPPARFSFR